MPPSADESILTEEKKSGETMADNTDQAEMTSSDPVKASIEAEETNSERTKSEVENSVPIDESSLRLCEEETDDSSTSVIPETTGISEISTPEKCLSDSCVTSNDLDKKESTTDASKIHETPSFAVILPDSTENCRNEMSSSLCDENDPLSLNNENQREVELMTEISNLQNELKQAQQKMDSLRNEVLHLNASKIIADGFLQVFQIQDYKNCLEKIRQKERRKF